jgi:hypothetical protein
MAGSGQISLVILCSIWYRYQRYHRYHLYVHTITIDIGRYVLRLVYDIWEFWFIISTTGSREQYQRLSGSTAAIALTIGAFFFCLFLFLQTKSGHKPKHKLCYSKTCGFLHLDVAMGLEAIKNYLFHNRILVLPISSGFDSFFAL